MEKEKELKQTKKGLIDRNINSKQSL